MLAHRQWHRTKSNAGYIHREKRLPAWLYVSGETPPHSVGRRDVGGSCSRALQIKSRPIHRHKNARLDPKNPDEYAPKRIRIRVARKDCDV
jgi:hypothetical protein